MTQINLGFRLGALVFSLAFPLLPVNESVVRSLPAVSDGHQIILNCVGCQWGVAN